MPRLLMNSCLGVQHAVQAGLRLYGSSHYLITTVCMQHTTPGSWERQPLFRLSQVSPLPLIFYNEARDGSTDWSIGAALGYKQLHRWTKKTKTLSSGFFSFSSKNYYEAGNFKQDSLGYCKLHQAELCSFSKSSCVHCWFWKIGKFKTEKCVFVKEYCVQGCVLSYFFFVPVLFLGFCFNTKADGLNGEQH